MGHGSANHELAVRFWDVVEDLAVDGDESVQNAVHVSLIEWFAWGGELEQAALTKAEPLIGRATSVMIEAYRPRAHGSRKSDRRRARRGRR